jgi:hypothetical protein
MLTCHWLIADEPPFLAIIRDGSAKGEAELALENDLFSVCPVSAREAETVVQIQFICCSTGGCAPSLSHLTPEQYRERKEIALELAEKLTDNFYRATALRHIIALCMAAKDPHAKSLLKQVGIAFIRQKIVEAHPELYER